MHYDSFLQHLDDSQLISHIQTLSQSQNKGASYFTSTPTRDALGPTKDVFSISTSSFGSDPFDDGLDSALLRLQPQVPPAASDFRVSGPSRQLSALRSFHESDNSADVQIAGNQLALVETDDDEAGPPNSDSKSACENDHSGQACTQAGEERHHTRQEVSNERIVAASGSPACMGYEGDYSQETFKNKQEDPLVTAFQSKENSPSRTVSKNSQQNSPSSKVSKNSQEHSPSSKVSKNSQESAQSDSGDSDAETTNFGIVGPQHEFGDHETYFENKYKKQHLADQEYIRWELQRRRSLGISTKIPQIFANCSIFVNGNTIPSLNSIHKTVILHGGIFLSHLQNKGAATHIVCDRLTPRKRIQFKNYRVVKAKWIVDCVSAQTLLDWKSYRLIDELEPYQKQLGFGKVDETQSRDQGGGVGDIGNTSLAGMEFGEFGNDNGEVKNDDGDAGPPNIHNATAESDSESKLNELNHNVSLPQIPGSSPDEIAGLGHDPEFAESGQGFEPETPMSGETKLEVEPIHPELAPQNLVPPNPEHNLSQLRAARPRTAFAQMDAKHPDFLRHFFANSRLHHLSTWKADLRSKFVRLVVKGHHPPPKPALSPTVILHIDFDCFFVAASALRFPDLDICTHAIAVSHGGNSSDIASCNYEARKKGVRNGMWLGRARELCAGLHVIDYDFDAYQRISHAFYTYLLEKGIFHSIYPVSIDEALVDASGYCTEHDVSSLCKEIRADVSHLTKCSVSVGAGHNVLLAKLALKQAKPDGFHVFQGSVDHVHFADLPGVGRGLYQKLADSLHQPPDSPILLRDVRELGLLRLSRVFGEKTAARFYQNSKGEDPTSIRIDQTSGENLGRKSVSVDVNYGIRFDTFPQAETFLINLAKELHSRMIDLGVCGSGVTLKVARKTPDAPWETPKYLGLGKVNFFSKSSSLGVATNDWGILGSEMKALFRMLNVPVQELRGIAVTVTKLEDVEETKKRQRQLSFRNQEKKKLVKTVVEKSQSLAFAEPVSGAQSIDWEVFNQLPVEIRSELKKELLRRGIPVSAQERSPKKSDGSKVYYQQVFPSQVNGNFKTLRIKESPKKKKKLSSPEKPRPSSPTRHDWAEYDENVLKELPTMIQDEFMQDLQRHHQLKELGLTMREKLEKKEKFERQIRERKITDAWLSSQKCLADWGSFNRTRNVHRMVSQVRSWVSQTASDGPHPDDVAVLRRYFDSLLSKGNLTRCLCLIDAVDAEVAVQRTVNICCLAESASSGGIQDWQEQVASLRKFVRDACAKRNVDV